MLVGHCLCPALQPALHSQGKRHKAQNQVEPEDLAEYFLPCDRVPNGGDAPRGLHQAGQEAGYRLRRRRQQILRGPLLAVPRWDPLRCLLQGQRDQGEVRHQLHQCHPGCEPGGAVPRETGQAALPADPVAADQGALLHQALRFLVGKGSRTPGHHRRVPNALPAGFHVVYHEISLQAGG